MKYNNIETKVNAAKSRPARGAWVEMLVYIVARLADPVAPRKGRVG